MTDRATVRDIAAEIGVSIATVSRVLNDYPHVAAGTRELVHRAIERLGEQAPTARSAAKRAARDAVYVRCPYLLSDYFGLIVSSIAETLELHGRHVVLDAGEASQQASVLPTLTRRPGIGGAIIILPLEPSEQLVALRASGFPFVVVDPRTPLPRDIAAVSAAHFSGARALTSHLVELGHRRIGVIAGPDEWLASSARMAGHASALADVGVIQDASLVLPGPPTTDFGFRAAAQLLDRRVRPSALIGFNDKAAVGAMAAAAECGLRVPDDVSITGFDDSDLAHATRPMLTTVRQPLQEMGRMAVSLLVRLLDGHRVDALHVELATELIVRGSTGPASTGGGRASNNLQATSR
ncbi:MAG: LacI family DNA-binding transcriptional regulator [Acidothermaceae bacterium]